METFFLRWDYSMETIMYLNRESLLIKWMDEPINGVLCHLDLSMKRR